MPFSLRRSVGLSFVVVLVLAALAGASEAPVAADFDGDGKLDQVTIDGSERSVLHIWLSRLGAKVAIRSPRPVLRVVAMDLDGDRRPELVATGTSSGLLVWKNHRRRGFRTYRPRQSLPHAAKEPGRGSVDGDPADAADALPPSGRAQDCADSRASPRIVDAGRQPSALPEAPPFRPTSCIASSAPRPPPALLA